MGFVAFLLMHSSGVDFSNFIQVLLMPLDLQQYKILDPLGKNICNCPYLDNLYNLCSVIVKWANKPPWILPRWEFCGPTMFQDL